MESNAPEYVRTLDRLRRLCSKREYCCRDMMERAVKSLSDEDAASRIVKELSEGGYVSDERYASAFARDKSYICGWGPAKIRYALISKGIAGDVIAEAMSGVDGEKSEEKLRRALEVKYRALAADPQVKIKLLKFALSRGHAYPIVEKVVADILKSKDWKPCATK